MSFEQDTRSLTEASRLWGVVGHGGFLTVINYYANISDLFKSSLFAQIS